LQIILTEMLKKIFKCNGKDWSIWILATVVMVMIMMMIVIVIEMKHRDKGKNE
jgi:ABC-type microcin C transport system permease subunit YejE